MVQESGSPVTQKTVKTSMSRYLVSRVGLAAMFPLFAIVGGREEMPIKRRDTARRMIRPGGAMRKWQGQKKNRKMLKFGVVFGGAFAIYKNTGPCVPPCIPGNSRPTMRGFNHEKACGPSCDQRPARRFCSISGGRRA